MKRFFYNLLIVIAVFIALASIFSSKDKSLLGYRIYRIASGSMEPNLKVGDFIIIKKQNEYDTGDIVTYVDKENYFVTHRITMMNGDEITTKGDANNTIDAPITKQQIIGKVVCKIHSLNFISYLLTRIEMWILVLVIGVITIIVFSKQKEDIKIKIKERRKKRRRKNGKE